MDIHNFSGSSSSKSVTSSLREGSESEEDSTNEAPPSKRTCAVPSSAATSQKYNKKWSTSRAFHGNSPTEENECSIDLFRVAGLAKEEGFAVQ